VQTRRKKQKYKPYKQENTQVNNTKQTTNIKIKPIKYTHTAAENTY